MHTTKQRFIVCVFSSSVWPLQLPLRAHIAVPHADRGDGLAIPNERDPVDGYSRNGILVSRERRARGQRHGRRRWDTRGRRLCFVTFWSLSADQI